SIDLIDLYIDKLYLSNMIYQIYQYFVHLYENAGLKASVRFFPEFRTIHSGSTRVMGRRPRTTNCTAKSAEKVEFWFGYQSQTRTEGPRLFNGLDVLHLPRLSRHGAAAAYVDQERRTDGSDLCFREHAAQASGRL